MNNVIQYKIKGEKALSFHKLILVLASDLLIISQFPHQWSKPSSISLCVAHGIGKYKLTK